jgi:crotonobetainyl-CoA:carnitine CoA-transferase CaiB-like acyl-CoA transferase
MDESGSQASLAGIKVIEIAMAMAGPFCGMMLADYGADVIKIERLGEGDESRRWAPFFPATCRIISPLRIATSAAWRSI